VHFPQTGWHPTPVHRFEALPQGERIAGPAIIENDFTTVVIDPGAVARRLPSGSLSVDVGFA